ncbi:cell envelope biogenesis protein OmpA [Aequorivita sp. H23M31]|uniref:Cell envelope biogenesis protein OmpA n=1 Tax=Aequorivita ciconiae TaxID=2494375 RepID=A0A410G5S3_9FLAO|nr:OmpA family protein [Aequorivita sp. H23M31]QAA82581.1 cell envelope biogenesis protein OmpA [Aequorivita sp. H23M31]
MKKIYTILLLLAVGTTMVTAQNSQTKKADRYYDRLQYTDAAEAYSKLIKKGEASPYVYERLANSYYFVNDTKQAETYYKKIIKGKDLDPETVYNYAQSLKANGKFGDYNTYMKQFAQMKPADSRAVAFMKNPNYLPKIIDEDAQKYKATNLGDVNSKYSDFGGTVRGNDFYFASSRNTNRKTYGWNDEPYLDIYKASIVGGVVKDAELVKGDVNTKYHESSPAFSPDGKRMYFDRNDYFNGKFKKDEEGINQLNIYFAENINGRWTNIQSAPFNDPEFSNSHPALSPDGNTLYFSSNRPGGIGKADIYKVTISANGTFGKPENLGSPINTEGNEGFPYVDSNGTLYFSSDGHLGMGGLDVFAADASGSGFGEVKNLGLGVNSSADDFAFTYDASKEEGYVSSNRLGGKGSDDIYKINKIESCEVNLIVLVVDANTNSPISGARLDLFDNMENKLKSKQTSAQGNERFSLSCDQAHVVQAFKEGYESNAATITASKEKEQKVRIALRPVEELIVDEKVNLNPILFDYDKHNIKPQAAFELDKLVDLMKRNPEMIIKVEAHTDSRGNDNYNMALSDKRAQSTVQYVISKGISKDRISGEGFGESRPAVKCGDNCTEEQYQQNRRSEFIIVKR